MAIYLVTVDNNWTGSCAFLFEAEDLIGATIKATDFLSDLDKKIASKIDEKDVVTKIAAVQNMDAFFPDEAGVEKFLSEIEVHIED